MPSGQLPAVPRSGVATAFRPAFARVGLRRLRGRPARCAARSPSRSRPSPPSPGVRRGRQPQRPRREPSRASRDSSFPFPESAFRWVSHREVGILIGVTRGGLLPFENLFVETGSHPLPRYPPTTLGTLSSEASGSPMSPVGLVAQARGPTSRRRSKQTTATPPNTNSVGVERDVMTTPRNRTESVATASSFRQRRRASPGNADRSHGA